MSAPRYVWCCNRGCGECAAVLAPYEYSRTEKEDGTLVESLCEPVLVSSCCGEALMCWDNDKDESVGFEFQVLE